MPVHRGLAELPLQKHRAFFSISYETICKLQKPAQRGNLLSGYPDGVFPEHEMLDAVVDGRMTILPSTAQIG